MLRNRRFFERVSVNIPCIMVMEDNADMQGIITNMSEDGICIEADTDKLKKGMKVDVQGFDRYRYLGDEKETVINCTGKVARIEDSKIGVKVLQYDKEYMKYVSEHKVMNYIHKLHRR